MRPAIALRGCAASPPPPNCCEKLTDKLEPVVYKWVEICVKQNFSHSSSRKFDSNTYSYLKHYSQTILFTIQKS